MSVPILSFYTKETKLSEVKDFYSLVHAKPIAERNDGGGLMYEGIMSGMPGVYIYQARNGFLTSVTFRMMFSDKAAAIKTYSDLCSSYYYELGTPLKSDNDPDTVFLKTATQDYLMTNIWHYEGTEIGIDFLFEKAEMMYCIQIMNMFL